MSSIVAWWPEFQTECYRIARSKGFHEADLPPHTAVGRLQLAQRLLLVHAEVSEAAEDLRTGADPLLWRVVHGKPVGFPIELADVVIRVANLAEATGRIDLAGAIDTKMRYNRTRPRMHGKVA